MNKSILELKSEKRDLVNQLNGVITTIEKRDKKNATAEERSEAEKIKTNITDLQNQIEKLEMSNKIEQKNVNQNTELRKLINGETDSVFIEKRALLASSTPGSYLVPEAKLPFERALYEEIPYLDMFTIKSSATREIINVPISDDTNVGEVLGEGSAANSQDVSYSNLKLYPWKYGSKKIVVSEEELVSAVDNVESDVQQTAGERIGRKIALDVVNGDGSGKIRGILQDATSGVTVANGSFAIANVISLFYTVSAGHRNNKKAAWKMNSATLATIAGKIDQNTQILLQYEVKDGQTYLMGKPVFINENMDSIGVNKFPVIFGNLGAYYLRFDGINFKKSIDQGFNDDTVLFKANGYVDGKLSSTKAIKTLKTT